MSCYSAYLEDVLEPGARALTIDIALRVLRAHQDEFDGIAFRGMSGALIAPALADALHKTLIMIRKPRSVEYSHTYRSVEGMHCNRYIIVDDMVASGETVRSIIQEVVSAGFATTPLPVAVYLYRGIVSQEEVDQCGVPFWTQHGTVVQPVTPYKTTPAFEPAETVVTFEDGPSASLFSSQDREILFDYDSRLPQVYRNTFERGWP